MGEVIRRDAAAQDILADARTTLANAKARGGDWLVTAEERLGAAIGLAESIGAQRQDAERVEAPAQAELSAADQAADLLLGRVSDDVWNTVGRPGQDPALDILFPGGIAYYADGDTHGQPDRMRLLAELLASGLHPRLPADRAKSLADEIRSAAQALEVKTTAARASRAKAELLRRAETSIARFSQRALAGLKRVWLADGKTEVEVHQVIPNRPTPPKTPKPAPPG